MLAISYRPAAALIAALAAIAAAWAFAAGITVSNLATPVLSVAVLVAIAALYRHRDPRIAHLAASVAALVGFSASGSLLSYLVVTLGTPPADPFLAAADRAMGFDWLAWSLYAEARPMLNLPLTVAYWSLLPVIVLAFMALSATGRYDRCAELVLCIIIGGVLTIAISAVLPALSAPVHLGVPERADMSGLLYAPYLPDLRALHDGTWAEFRMGSASGIISFPSYHATLTLLVAHALRRTRLFWPAVVLAVLTVLSIPSVGLHYLIDIPGGVLVALLAVAGYGLVNRSGGGATKEITMVPVTPSTVAIAESEPVEAR